MEDDGAACVEKPTDTDGDQTVPEETTKEVSTVPPADSGECAPISGDAKIESSVAATTAQPPVAEGPSLLLSDPRLKFFLFEIGIFNSSLFC